MSSAGGYVPRWHLTQLDAGEVVVPLDPRWEWVEERTLCQPGATLVRGACNHLDTVDVESVLDPDVILARLCLTCDTQLDAAPAPHWPTPTTTELHAGVVSGALLPLPNPVIPTRE